MNANGETRRWVAFTFASAALAAVGTKLGEWAVDALRRRYGHAPPAPNPAPRPDA